MIKSLLADLKFRFGRQRLIGGGGGCWFEGGRWWRVGPHTDQKFLNFMSFFGVGAPFCEESWIRPSDWCFKFRSASIIKGDWKKVVFNKFIMFWSNIFKVYTVDH